MGGGGGGTGWRCAQVAKTLHIVPSGPGGQWKVVPINAKIGRVIEKLLMLILCQSDIYAS